MSDHTRPGPSNLLNAQSDLLYPCLCAETVMTSDFCPRVRRITQRCGDMNPTVELSSGLETRQSQGRLIAFRLSAIAPRECERTRERRLYRQIRLLRRGHGCPCFIAESNARRRFGELVEVEASRRLP